MALTTEQEAEIITRLEAGERGPGIARSMGIVRSEFRLFRESNLQVFREAKGSKSARLFRLRYKKAEMESRIVEIDAAIAGVEAE